MMSIVRLGIAAAVLAIGIGACGDSPVQPDATIAASVSSPSFGKAKAPASCESLVYPSSLCEPSNRPALCAALRGPEPVTFDHPFNGSPATETFTRTAPPFPPGSLEAVTIPSPYGFPPTVMKFWILDPDIAALCAATA
jgi:hypothetical protein